MMSAVLMSCFSRSVASARLPIGVAASTIGDSHSGSCSSSRLILSRIPTMSAAVTGSQADVAEPTPARASPPNSAGGRSGHRRWLESRLSAQRCSPGLWGWLVPAVVAAFAAALRFTGIGNPHQLIFDETYYAKDAYALLQAGYELTWPEEADGDFLAGDPQVTDEPSYVVNPPLGKWLIAVGIRLFGTETALGWRCSAAVAGVVGVLLVAVIARRMFRSVFLGGVAGDRKSVV